MNQRADHITKHFPSMFFLVVVVFVYSNLLCKTSFWEPDQNNPTSAFLFNKKTQKRRKHVNKMNGAVWKRHHFITRLTDWSLHCSEKLRRIPGHCARFWEHFWSCFLVSTGYVFPCSCEWPCEKQPGRSLRLPSRCTWGVWCERSVGSKGRRLIGWLFGNRVANSSKYKKQTRRWLLALCWWWVFDRYIIGFLGLLGITVLPGRRFHLCQSAPPCPSHPRRSHSLPQGAAAPCLSGEQRHNQEHA